VRRVQNITGQVIVPAAEQVEHQEQPLETNPPLASSAYAAPVQSAAIVGRKKAPSRKKPPALERHALRFAVPVGDQIDPKIEAQAIRGAFTEKNHWSDFLTKHSTRADVAHIEEVAKTINPAQADEITTRFFRIAAKTLAAQPIEVTRRFQELPDNWYSEPVYYAYAQHFGTPDGKSSATFDSLIGRLDHLEYLGIKNIFLLPHYESPGGDGGYDVSSFEPKAELGGTAAYERFMKEAIARGFRVMTDIPANHTSTQHKWFQALLRGDKEKLDYYVRVDGAKIVSEEPVNIDGRPRNIVRHADGMLSAVWLIFPHASDKHWIDVEVNGEPHQIFHSFYPFQVDLNLANPGVLEDLLGLLGSEANVGNVGKRMDAAPHWFKKPGTDFESLKETHALQALFKSFIRHVVPGKGITLPEVGFGIDEAAKYFGKPIEIAGVPTSSEGDGIFAFEMQAALREMIFTGNADAFWRTYDSLPVLPDRAVWLNMLGHHDEMRTDLMSPHVRADVRAQLLAKGAMDFAGRGLGGRTANLLEHDPSRIASAYFNLYMAPGTPVIYYGDEIGAANQPEFMKSEQKKRHDILNELGVPTSMERALDTRDLNRGPISAKDFDRARAEKYQPVETLRALNALRDELPALRTKKLERLPVDRDDVLALVREGERSLVALSNLSDKANSVRMSRARLEAAIGPIPADGLVEDVLASKISGAPRRVKVELEGETAVVHLGPYAHILM
jgi:maltose alpha-D-glucosyltransferase/alpha-amylase